MAEPFLAEIRIVSFNLAPAGWALCDGQLLPINQNQALFSILGTTYGGNGQTNFALPDLRSRTPIHVGGGRTLGERSGEQSHTLSVAEAAAHTHLAQGINSPGDTGMAQNSPLGKNYALTAANTYGDAANLQPLSPQVVTSTGGSQPHENMQPYLVLTFIIALQGIFPSRN